MIVNLGYKHTEVGVIPEEWNVAPLSNVVERLDAGVSVTSVDEEFRNYAHEQMVLKTSAIAGGRFFPHESKKIAPRDIGRAKLNPRFNTVIISRMNTPDLVGECGYVPADFPNLFLPDRLWMSRNRPGSKVNVKWLSYLLSSKPYRARIKDLASGTSGSMKNIAKDSLLAMPIAYPTLPEQGAIADALSDVDRLLDELDRLILKKRDIKQAAMQQLLSGQTRLPGFHGEWEVKKIGDFTDCTAGGTPSTREPSYWGGSIKWMSSGELNLRRVEEVEGRITELGLRNSSTKLLPKKCVLIGLAGQGKTRGTVAINSVELCTNQSIAAVFPNSGFVSEYLYFNLESRYNELRELSAGDGGRGGLNLKIIKGIPIPFPSLLEQSAIAEVLMDMDVDLTSSERRREKTSLLKQAMMQELLTGRTRLI